MLQREIFDNHKLYATLCHDTNSLFQRGPHACLLSSIKKNYTFQVLAPQGQDAIAEDMRQFADQLRPLVQLDKIDYKRLGHMPVT